MHHLSSSWTIFLRLFIPVFWGVFFGCFTIAMFAFREELGPVLGTPNAAWIFLGCYLTGVVIIYFSLWRLYRVDADNAFFYVTNFFKTYKYPNEIGPGVYDIHSPRVPKVAEMTELLQLARERLVDAQIWINPDCGLKTRKWDEVRPALVNMVEAARQLRAAM